MRTLFITLIVALSTSPALAQVSSNIPPDVKPEASDSDYYHFAWQSFIALNWPVADDVRGKPDTMKQFGAVDRAGVPNPVVWESYQDKFETFRGDENGKPIKPGSWNSKPVPGQTPIAKLPPGGKWPYPKVTGAEAMLATEFTQASYHSLWDQQGRFIRYEVKINQTTFEYFKATNYYDAQAQQDANLDLKRAPYSYQNLQHTFPDNREIDSMPAYAQQGLILCKGSWRVLDDLPEAIQQRYFRHHNCFMLTPDQRWTGPHTLGLVGFHIVRNTPHTQDTWFWSTFEHVDNVALPGTSPTPGATPALNPIPAGKQARFGAEDSKHFGDLWQDATGQSDPDPLTYGLRDNFFGPRGIQYTYPDAPEGTHHDLIDVLGLDRSEEGVLSKVRAALANESLLVSRWQNIEPAVAEVNDQYQQSSGIQDTVWRHYQLVGVQHPIPVTPATDSSLKFENIQSAEKEAVGIVKESQTVAANISVLPVADASKQSLANTTMETYLQGVSCLGCHNGAGRSAKDTADAGNVSLYGQSLFTFLFSRGPTNITGYLIQPPPVKQPPE